MPVKRILLVISAVFVAGMLAGTWVIASMLDEMALTGAAVDYSGRQRALSQRAAKVALVYGITRDERTKAQLHEFETSMDGVIKALQEGDPVKQVPQIADAQFQESVAKVKAAWVVERRALAALAAGAAGMPDAAAVAALQDSSDVVVTLANDATRMAAYVVERKATVIRNTAIAMLAGGVGLFAAIFVFLMLRLFRPLEHVIQRLTQDITAGDLRVVLPAGNDEVGKLSGAVNHLVVSLRRLIADARAADERLVSLAGEMAGESALVVERNGLVADRMAAGSAATEEMSQAARGIAEHAADVAYHARETSEGAQRSAQTMNKTVADVGQTIGSIESAADSIAALTSRINEIGSMATIIQEIADQTNLLALNAAIEAARAGEAGRGFAVVADEVRKLAEKTGQSTKTITEGVADVVGAASHVKEVMTGTQQHTRELQVAIAELEGSLDVICISAEQLHDVATSIVTATQEQRLATETTAESLATINSMSDESQQMAADLQARADQVRMSAIETDAKLAHFKI